MNKAVLDSPYLVPASALTPRLRRSVVDRIRRVSRMPLAELAGRGMQEAAKMLDRAMSGGRAVDPLAIVRDHAPALSDVRAASQILREIVPSRFFAGVEYPSIVGELWPDHRAFVLNGAAEAMQNRFDLLGYQALWFGDPIDWHLDPLSSRRAPNRHWTELDPLDCASVGDSKVVWELNRHQWVARIAEAYALTCDERYAEHALRAIDAWIDANPYGMGINWSSSLEVAYRIMSWAWTLLLLRDSAALSESRLTRILAGIWLHATHVARYLSFYFSPNTHLTGEALGLFYAGTLFPEFHAARRWRQIGERVLVSESRTQLCADGVHFERSTCYHRYTIETYQQFLLLAARNRIQVPADLGDRLQSALEFALSIRRPDGSLPEMGDADGGRLLPLVERQPCDPRGVFGVGAAMFGRDDFAWAADRIAPEVPWLMGENGIAAFAERCPSTPSGAASRIFPSGGYAVMKSGWDREAHQMIIDVGPLGCPFSSGHGHADLLSVQCSAFGEPILVDAGTYCYTPEPEWRNFFRGTAAHGTLRVDGRDQVESDGPFSWQGRARVRVREWRSGHACDFVDASHTAYPGVVHRRRVLFVKPDYWVIVDDVAGDPPYVHRLDLGFQFAPISVAIVRERWVRAETPRGNTFWIGSFAPALARPAIQCGTTAPIRGWVSRDYGQRAPAPLVTYTTRMSKPWRSITVLMPRRGSTRAVPLVSPLTGDDDLPIGLELEDAHESIFVDEVDIFRSTSK